ncbi:hypothetical protein [Aphanothece sacrum]|uniref:Uncharacterized protein n=1 Tax=Aphanothece sacrum FPU1 TaxID=1920663 RepID=A0A401IJQ8_APHSA|nr:hypothetical protein [Aphanothece sacrum]GBF81410.1 hypothetical protein AsFPU1_2823 [Aphanothece sacrum FPU1]GBF85399.1 hypothetical protein AsFPU3_2458 [Aphanothece sacrum FPU3]
MKLGQRFVLNTFIAFILFLILIDGLPETSLLHGRLKQMIDPIVDAMGIWQGSWQLFAPNVDKINSRIIAKITFSDLTQGKWSSPDWTQMSIWERFIKFRYMEYYDGVRLQTYQKTWPHLAEYLAKNIVSPNNPEAKPIKIFLIQEWVNIPPPNDNKVQKEISDNQKINYTQLYTWQGNP